MGASSRLKFMGQLLNKTMSFVVFSALDLLDVLLCLVYKIIDYIKEAEWKPCYCSSSAKHTLMANGKILVFENGSSKIISLHSSSKLHLEDISDTLYHRPSLASDIWRLKSEHCNIKRVNMSKSNKVMTTYTVNSTIVRMLQGKVAVRKPLSEVPRWSDCDCKTCNSWSYSMKGLGKSLYAHVQEPPDGLTPKGDVLFIHGFISSSSIWTETVFSNFTNATKSKYRMIAIDLLGFGQSPKPADSLYTLREHVEMIEGVVERYNMKSFHIVAHSLGSILALALASKHPDSIKSLTLLAPPYFPVPTGEQGSQYVLKQVAPRRVWPPLTFGGSVVCWYEHISRTICLLVCKNHKLWESLFKFVTRNRIKSFLIKGFFCHTHNAAWHTIHNIICGTADKIDGYLDTIRDHLKCNVTIIHGRDDEVLSVNCSIAVKSKIPRANVRIIDSKDHITVIVGRQKEFARELEEIWWNSEFLANEMVEMSS